MKWWMIIGFLILLVLGTLVTLYFLKPKLLNLDKEGFQSALTPQIYLVSNKNNSAINHTEALAVCLKLGGRLAVATEVYNAALAGTNWTTAGWIGEDRTYGYIPVSAGNSHSGANGPAIVRWDAETSVDCDGNYTVRAPGSAICYGLLPAETDQHSILPTGGSFRSLSLQMIDIEGGTNLSSMFDTTDSLTLLDLDAIHLQKSMIAIDMADINNQVYNIEKSLTLHLRVNPNILNIED